MVFLLKNFLVSEAYISTEFYLLKNSFLGEGEGDKYLKKHSILLSQKDGIQCYYITLHFQ